MSNYSKIYTFILLNTLLFSCKVKEDISIYAPTEKYPVDVTLNSINNKKAMIIIAHDDDMCGTTGTISMLNNAGREIRVLSFPQSEERNKAHKRACKNILDSVIFFNISHSEFRNDLNETEKLYEAIAKLKFKNLFNYDIVERQLIKQVNDFEPAVIFTLDNLVGAYGHPEHVFISQMVLDLSEADSISPSYIYQNVFTDHMENTIMARHSKRMKEWGFAGDDWEITKQTYKVDGQPEPTTEINIEKYAQQKMNYLKSYNERERQIMGFYIPAFEDYNAEEYFKIFNREFYRVIKIN